MPENATNLLIVDQVIKTEKVKWKELTVLQPENFKKCAEYLEKTLEQSDKIPADIKLEAQASLKKLQKMS